MTSFKPNCLPKDLPSNAITLGLGLQHRNWGQSTFQPIALVLIVLNTDRIPYFTGYKTPLFYVLLSKRELLSIKLT